MNKDITQQYKITYTGTKILQYFNIFNKNPEIVKPQPVSQPNTQPNTQPTRKNKVYPEISSVVPNSWF